MQTGGAVRGVKTIPWRGWLEALLAIAVVVFLAAMMVLLVWTSSTTTGGVDSGTAVPARAGNAYVHDDAGAVNPGLAPGSAVVHDDAGNVGR